MTQPMMLSNFYPEAVRENQRAQFFVRENYLDISAGNFDFRLGRQHVIWGEMVGLFFADVVSAKDLREFILPSVRYTADTAMGGSGRVFQK